MKDTIKKCCESKIFWTVLTFQIIAIEPFLPLIHDYLPEEYKYIGVILIPMAIIWAKIIRDKGFLETKCENKKITPRKTRTRKTSTKE